MNFLLTTARQIRRTLPSLGQTEDRKIDPPIRTEVPSDWQPTDCEDDGDRNRAGEGETRGREIARSASRTTPVYPYPSPHQLGPVTVQYSDARLGVEPACVEQELDGIGPVENEEEEKKAGSTSQSTKGELGRLESRQH